MHVFKMVTKIRGFFGPYSKFYVGKFLLQFMKIKNISRQSLKIQMSSPTVFTMRMRKINLAPNPTMASVFTAPKCMQTLALSISNEVWMTDRYNFI